jgi:serine/threonine-protein kinase
VTTTGPALDIVDDDGLPEVTVEQSTEPAPPPAPIFEARVDPGLDGSLDPIIELRHPKAVPALHLSDVILPARDRHRALAGRAALVVGAAAALALAATHAGSCAARFARSQALTPAAIPASVVAPTAAPIPPTLPATAAPKGGLPPPLGAPPPSTELVPAGEESTEAFLRVQVEGPATYVVDGRSMHAGADGAVRLSPGHHRVVVSSPLYAYPRTLEVDLRPRESATRVLPRGRGTLRVAVTPWAEVTVDGRVLGVTPLQPVDLAEGAHQISLRNGELGIVAKRRITIAPNRESLLKLDLFGEKR